MQRVLMPALILLLHACSLVYSADHTADANGAHTGGNSSDSGGAGAGGTGGKASGAGGSSTGTGGVEGDAWVPTSWDELSKCELFLVATYMRYQGETTWKVVTWPIGYYATFDLASSTLTLALSSCGIPCFATSLPYESLSDTQRKYEFEDHSEQAAGTLGSDGLLTFTAEFKDGKFSAIFLDATEYMDAGIGAYEVLLETWGCAVRAL